MMHVPATVILTLTVTCKGRRFKYDSSESEGVSPCRSGQQAGPIQQPAGHGSCAQCTCHPGQRYLYELIVPSSLPLSFLLSFLLGSTYKCCTVGAGLRLHERIRHNPCLLTLNLGAPTATDLDKAAQ